MPLPNGMKKLQELPVGMDWELVRAGATPGPGQYEVNSANNGFAAAAATGLEDAQQFRSAAGRPLNPEAVAGTNNFKSKAF